MAAQQSSPQSRPFSAVIRAGLVRGGGIDFVEEIEFTSGCQFTRRVHTAGGPDLGPIVVLDAQQRRRSRLKPADPAAQ